MEREFFQTREQRLAYIVDMMESWDEEEISDRRVEEALARGRDEGIAEGMEQGMAQGMEQGMAQGKMETARNLLRMGLSPEQIVEATGLSAQEIQALR